MRAGQPDLVHQAGEALAPDAEAVDLVQVSMYGRGSVGPLGPLVAPEDLLRELDVLTLPGLNGSHPIQA